MKSKYLLAIVLALGTGFVLLLSHSHSQMGATPGPPMQTGSARYDIKQAYGQLPLSFEVIPGARNGEAKTIARGRGLNLFLIGSDAIMAVGNDDPEKMDIVRMRVLGGNSKTDVIGVGRLGKHSNYLIGNDPKNWRIDIPNFERVLLHDVYPGIDLTYYGKQGDLEYDFVVAPRSDPRQIRLSFVGAQHLKLAGGNLLLRLGNGELRLHEPIVYQVHNGKKVPIPARFFLDDHDVVSFDLGTYDRRRTLVIDPGLVYSSYLGGSGRDEGLGIAVGRDGCAYVIGSTTSMDFPASASGRQRLLGPATAQFSSPSSTSPAMQ